MRDAQAENSGVQSHRQNCDGDHFCDYVQYRFGKALERRLDRNLPEFLANCRVVGLSTRTRGAPSKMMRDLLKGVGLEFAVAGSAEHQANLATFGHLTVDGGYGHLEQ